MENVSVLLKFFLEGHVAGDMIRISQRDSWSVRKADDPESYLQEQTVEIGESGAVIFQGEDLDRIAFVFDSGEANGVFSSHDAALQAFSNQDLGSGQVDLNRLRSGFRIVGYHEGEFSIDDLKSYGRSVEAPIRIMIGDQKMIIEEGGRIDFTEILANYIEDNPLDSERNIYIFIDSEAEQDIIVKDLEIIYS